MDILMLYLGAVGVGMIGCISVISVRVNKIASVLHIAFMLFTAVYAMMNFGFLHMLGAILTILVVGMVLAYAVLKTREKKENK